MANTNYYVALYKSHNISVPSLYIIYASWQDFFPNVLALFSYTQTKFIIDPKAYKGQSLKVQTHGAEEIETTNDSNLFNHDKCSSSFPTLVAAFPTWWLGILTCGLRNDDAKSLIHQNNSVPHLGSATQTLNMTIVFCFS